MDNNPWRQYASQFDWLIFNNAVHVNICICQAIVNNVRRRMDK